ncbi:MAG: PHP domain-containing protein [Prolixibacteraceae bacterium]
MPLFKADLHIHTLTSPCGSLEMSPVHIIEMALEKKLDIIAITDHNCTKQVQVIQEMAVNKGLLVIGGAEVNSSEEVHCLTLFETKDQLDEFQFFIDQHLLPIPNDPTYFGDQVVIDKDEMIVEELPYLLTNALDCSLSEIEIKVHELNGIVIPAHVDRPYNGLFSQLGFIPEHFKADAFELSKNAHYESWISSGKLPFHATIVTNSDAHHPHQIGERVTWFELKELTFREMKLALNNEEGNRVVPPSKTSENLR